MPPCVAVYDEVAADIFKVGLLIEENADWDEVAAILDRTIRLLRAASLQALDQHSEDRRVVTQQLHRDSAD